MMGPERDAGLGDQVGMSEISDHQGSLVFWSALRKGDMDDGSCAAQFDGLDCEFCRADSSATEEAELQRYGVGLILGGKGGEKVDICYPKDTGCDIAALRD